MKPTFRLLVLGHKGAGTTSENPLLQRLLEMSDKHGVRVEYDGAPRMCLGHTPVHERPSPMTVYFVAGNTTPDELLLTVEKLTLRNLGCIVLVDALENRGDLRDTLRELNRQGVQLMKVAGAIDLMRMKRVHLYAYAKADVTTTTFVFLDWHTSDPLVLTIERGHEPEKDKESAPGGFLDVMLESVKQCAGREVFEETSVVPDKLEFLDERSDVDRDERHHVVDHGFAWFVPRRQRNKVLKTVKAADDAKPGTARFNRLSELKKRSLAFDHAQLLQIATKRLNQKRRDYLKRQRARRTAAAR